MPTVHGYDVSGFKGLLAEMGIRHQDVLRRAGLPEDILEPREIRLQAEDFFALTGAIEEAVGDPSYTLQMADAMSAEWFSPPIFASLCSPNLAVAAQRLSRFKPLVAPIELEVANGNKGLTLRYRWEKSALPPPKSLHGAEALFIVKIARLGTRHHVCPTSVTLPTLPDARTAHEEWLGVKLRAGKTLSVTFSVEDAARPFLTESHAMWNIFEPELRERLADMDGTATFKERTRAILLEALPSGLVSVDNVAKRLAVSSRTLQRRLYGESTNFKAVVRETREQLARHYLAQPNLTVTEIAYLVGFDEPTSFFRAFHAWTGSTPETIRSSLAGHA